MLYYYKIEGIDLTGSINNKECIICHYWYFYHGFKFQNFVYIGCNEVTVLCIYLRDVTVKGADYRYIIHNISISDTIHLLQKSLLDARGYIKMHVKEINVKNRI